MDGFQFTASIVQSIVSLAWPAAFVTAVWLFREKLIELLPRLHVKHKETEFRFDQAEAEVAQISVPQSQPELEATPEEKSRFQKVAEHSPRAAILEKRAELEQALKDIARLLVSEPASRSRIYSMVDAIRILRNEGLLDEKTSALLDDLRVIGNRAAHLVEDSEFSFAEAMRYGKLADDTIKLLRALQ
ncbi:DUF4145 domain-containing protein [Xanthobacteraceae bacterium Astr-EGSB]|uniref:DUF4145 domain-containing protein n=1 Tax=Astrobacterium formosum TaxID=3069710 RepID=UPI0027B7921B|nr:DUF4145 domain-containing protein [Xanthobacteraceae bacterium Astr-EGSB]